jgi:hypothetical protein
MKIYLLLIVFCILFLSAKNRNNNNVIRKIISGELIPKKDLNELFPGKFSKYGNKIIATQYISNGDLFIGVVKGTKKDMIYNSLLVFKNERPVSFKETPQATFYRRKDGAIVEKFVLGRIFLEDENGKCINVYTESVAPFRIDTLGYEFRYNMAKRLKLDSLKFCD